MVQERKKEAKRPEGELNEFKEAEKNGATYKHNNVREIRKKRTSQRKKGAATTGQTKNQKQKTAT